MKAEVVKLDASGAGSIDLDDEIFGLEPRADVAQPIHAVDNCFHLDGLGRHRLPRRRAGQSRARRRGAEDGWD